MNETIRVDTYINVIDNNSCNICFNEYSNDEIVTTNCGHIYCEDCLLKWFRRSKTSCPICVQDVDYYIKKNEKNHIIRINNSQNNNRVNNIENNRVNDNQITIRLPKWKINLLKYMTLFNLSYISYLFYNKVMLYNKEGNYSNCSGILI